MAATRPDAVHTRVRRTIAADPTSTALLLAGPTALDLWPGLRRTGEEAGRVLVEAPLAAEAGPVLGAVRALPPRRTPTSYVTRFETSGPGLPVATGLLTLAYSCGETGSETEAVLELDTSHPGEAGLSEPCIRHLASGFLDNLAAAAEARNRAA